MVLDAGDKLIGHLGSHERMGNTIPLEIVVQRQQIQTQFFGDDVQLGTYRQRGINLHR